MTTQQITVNGRTVTVAKVKSITPAGKKHVFDLSVAGANQYIANGVVVHNCGYHEHLIYQGKRIGIEYLKFNSLYLSYRHKNVELYPLGPLKRALRGDCVVGSTLINTTQGFVRFDELGFKEGLHEATGYVDTPKGLRAYSHTYKKQSRETIRVTTRNRYSIRGTPEHPLLTLAPDLNFRWKRLDEIQVGDWIVSRTKLNSPTFGHSPITKDAAELMGFFTANGNRCEVSSSDPAVVKRLYKAAKRVTGYTPTYLPVKDRKNRADSHYVRMGSKGHRKGVFTDVLASWGYNNKTAKDKEIPLSVRTAPREVLHAYLEAYFSCDSGINGGSTRKARKKGQTSSIEVELSSASSRLVEQLQVLLLHVYGIVGRRSKKVEYKCMGRYKQNPEKRYVTWVLTLTGYDAWLFFRTFKRAKVQRYKDRVKFTPAGYGSDRRQIPFVRELTNLKWRQFPKGKYQTSEGEVVCKPGRPSWGYGKRHARSPLPEYMLYEKDSQDALCFLDIVDAGFAKRIRRLLALEAHYEEIVSVVRLERKVPVYDLTVPEGHAFTANGLVSHNTRVVAAVDELGWFPVKALEGDNENPNEEEAGEREFANADEVYTALDNSLSTVRVDAYNLYKKGINHVPTGINLLSSSPSSWKDKICRLLKDSEGSKVMLGLNLPTWEVNPGYTRDHPLITEAYRKNAVRAERDFGANPPELSSSLYNKDNILEMFKGKLHHVITTVTFKETRTEQLSGKVLTRLDRGGKWPNTVLAIDGGYSNNAFSFALGHLDQPEGGNPKLHVFTIGEIVPRAGRKINFVRVYADVIYPLCKNCNVKFLFADRWNSIMLLQSAMRDFPLLKATLYSLKPVDFKSFDQDIIDNQALVLPELEMDPEVIESVADYKKAFVNKPASHLYLQFLTVRYSGGTVVKGDGYTDDIYRSLVLLATASRNKKVAEETRKHPLTESASTQRSAKLAIVAGRSGRRRVFT